jgi:hypothetical protein
MVVTLDFKIHNIFNTYILIHTLYSGNSVPKICATSLIFKEVPKVNTRQTGEDSSQFVHPEIDFKFRNLKNVF